MTTYTITDGPLIGHWAESDTAPVFVPERREAFQVGLRLEGTGRTYTDRAGTTWIQARTPWMVQTGRGGNGLWFHAGYITPVAEVRSGVLGVLDRWRRAVEGRQLEVDGVYGPQCVDGAKDWNQWAVGTRSMGAAYGHAKNFARGICSAYPDRLQFLTDGSQVQAADTVSLGRPFGVDPETGEVYGHVAVALGPVVNGRFPCLQQDGFDDDTTMTVGSLPVSAVVGIARPRPGALVKAAPGAQTLTHTIAAGDTLWSLARRYGASVATLIELNPGIEPDNLRIGSTLAVAR